METIFYVLFRSANSLHDYMEYFSEQKTLQDYMNWQGDKKKELEKKLRTGVIVENFDVKFLKKTKWKRQE